MTTEDRYTRVFARKLAELDRTVEGLSRAQQVTRTVLPTTSGPVGLEDMLENSVDVSEDVAVQREAISLLDEITSTSHDSWQGNEDSNFENAEGAHEAYMASIDAYAGVVVAQDEARAAVEEAANALTTANGKNARRRGVVQPLPPAGGWVQGDQWVRDVITGTPVEVRRNTAENPRMVSAVSLPLDNLPGVIVTTKSVPLPAPLPGGIPVTTCLEGRIEGAGEGPFLLSVYGINGKIAGDSPNAGMGCYVYVTEPGYRVPAMSGWAETLLDAGVWTWCQTDGLLTSGAWTGLMVSTVDGSTPSTTARAYVTAVTQTPGGVPDAPFDGGYTLVPGTIPQWETESPNPVGESRLVTADVEATEVLVWNGTEFVHETLLTGELLVLGPGGIVRLADGAVTADSIAADAIDGMIVTGATIRTAAAGQRLQLDADGLKAYNAAGAVVATMRSDGTGMDLSDSSTPGDGNGARIVPGSVKVYSLPNGTELNISGNTVSARNALELHSWSLIGGSKDARLDLGPGVMGNRGHAEFSADTDVRVGGRLHVAEKVTSSRGLTVLANPGGVYLLDTQVITLSEPVSNQLNGIILEWSGYSGTAPDDTDWNYTHIPKVAVGKSPVRCPIYRGTTAMQKAVAVSDTSITGYAANQTAPRDTIVLRAVYGY